MDVTVARQEGKLQVSRRGANEGIEWIVVGAQRPPILGDPENLGRMVDNLVGNAIKYVHEEGHVEVSLKRLDGWIELKVRDNRPGIASEKQARIFDRFARARDAGTSGVPGFGLGLPIARAVAEAHGGTIGVDSSPGTGTTFWVRLPAAA